MKKFPSRFIKILDDIQKDFIWSKLQPKIKHSNLIGNYKEDGYKKVDVASKMNSLKVIWIRRLTGDNVHTWKIIPSKLFRPIGVTSFFHRNFKLADSCMRVVETFQITYLMKVCNILNNIKYLMKVCGITVL